MLAVLRFEVTDEAAFRDEAAAALAALAARPGYLRGQLGRAFDDPAVWCLVTEWESVGTYRRALSAYEVKLVATPFLSRARPEPSAFEALAVAAAGGPVTVADSDRTDGSIASRP